MLSIAKIAKVMFSLVKIKRVPKIKAREEHSSTSKSLTRVLVYFGKLCVGVLDVVKLKFQAEVSVSFNF